MSVEEFVSYYWLMAELTEFAKRLGLPAHGPKPELSRRIEQRLRGAPSRPEPARPKAKGPRDSDAPLTRDTPVRNYRSDARTRAFFGEQIGPEFHFTYHLNQFRMAREGITYGDLVDEWLAEKERRKQAGYKAPIAKHGEYNRFVRDFFADEANKGKALREAVAAWNAVKSRRDRRYKPRTSRARKTSGSGS
jgi:hypothetical protein